MKKYLILFLMVLMVLAFAAPAWAATADPPASGGLLSLLESNLLIGSLLAIVALVILDVLTRIAVALLKGSFDRSKVLDFLRTNVVPYVIAWGAIELLLYAANYVAFPAATLTPFVGIGAIIYAGILLKLIASVLGNLRDLGISAGT